MAEDFRLTVTFPDDSGTDLAASLSEHELEDEARKKLGAGISVSADGPNVFLYADTRDAADGAKGIVETILEKEGAKAAITLARWHPLAEEWEPVDAPMPQTAAEREAEHEKLEAQDTADSLTSGYAEWEVLVALPSHGDAVELAERLEYDGHPGHPALEAPDRGSRRRGRRERPRRAPARGGPGGVRVHRGTGPATRNGLGGRPEALPLVLLRPEHVAEVPTGKRCPAPPGATSTTAETRPQATAETPAVRRVSRDPTAGSGTATKL